MNGVQTRFKCKLDVKRCKRFVFPPSSLLPRSNALKTKAIRYFQTDRTLTRIVSPPLRTIEFHDDFDMIVAIANGGIVPAGIINQRLQKEVHLLRINLRDEYQHPKYDAPQLLAPVDFDFKDKSILLVDDRIKTGSTIRLACELLKEARMIKTFAVNGTADYALFDETCFKFPWIL